MRLAVLVSYFGFLAGVASAATTVNQAPPAPPAVREYPPLRLRHPQRNSIPANVDAQVLANLFAAEARSDFDVAVSTGTMSCDVRICLVAINVRLPETTAPARLSFAVAGPKGELSEVRHADCLTSVCTVQLVLERGRNVIAVGAADGVTRTAGFATTQVQVVAPMSAQRKMEWF